MAATLHTDPTLPEGATRRRFGRLMCQDIQCSLGTVLDISASGMRVLTKTTPPPIGQDVCIRLESLGEELRVTVRAVWVRKVGWGKREVGLAFGAMGEESRRTLTTLARASAHNEHMRDFRESINHKHE